jgi:hypothetical protein
MRMNVFVFKTSIEEAHFAAVKQVLSKVLSDTKWNFDFEDCDNILRIETQHLDKQKLADSLNALGFECIELL